VFSNQDDGSNNTCHCENLFIKKLDMGRLVIRCEVCFTSKRNAGKIPKKSLTLDRKINRTTLETAYTDSIEAIFLISEHQIRRSSATVQLGVATSNQ